MHTQFHCTIDTIVLRSANQNQLDPAPSIGIKIVAYGWWRGVRSDRGDPLNYK